MRNFLLFISIVGMISCTSDKDNFVVKGTVDGGEDKIIYLKKLELRSKSIVDSAKIDSKGNFELSGDIEIPDFYTLEYGVNGMIHLVIHPGEEITVNTDAGSFGDPYIVYGSVDSERINRLIKEQREMFTALKSNFMQFQDSLGSPNIQELLVFRDNRRDSIIESYTSFTRNFIEEKPQSFSSLMALYQVVGPNRPVLRVEDDLNYFKMVDSALTLKYPSAEPVKSLNQMIVQLENKRTAPGLGDAAINFALPTPEGDTLMLSDLKGQYVLLDFWASWCSPCRKENPNLVKAYKMFKDKNFTILQVSLDKNKSAWVKGIEDDLLEWYHVSDLKYWESPIAAMYKVESIPSSFLLNPQQTIIGVNLRGSGLIDELNKVLK